MIYNFLGDNKPDKIARKLTIHTNLDGGLNMKNITTFIQSISGSTSLNQQTHLSVKYLILAETMNQLSLNVLPIQFGRKRCCPGENLQN